MAGFEEQLQQAGSTVTVHADPVVAGAWDPYRIAARAIRQEPVVKGAFAALPGPPTRGEAAVVRTLGTMASIEPLNPPLVPCSTR